MTEPTQFVDEHGMEYADPIGKTEKVKKGYQEAVKTIKNGTRIIDGKPVKTMIIDANVDPEACGTKSTKYVNMFGCKNCSWSGTDLCPYGIGIKMKHGKVIEEHSNGICRHRKEWMMDVSGVSRGRRITTLQVGKLYEDLELEKFLTKKMLETLDDEGGPTVRTADVINMRKHTADTLAKIRKQDEGVKIEHTRAIKPSDIAQLIKQAKAKEIENNAVDAEVIEDEI